METIKVGRYDHPESHGWGGWVEPENREWILFLPAVPSFDFGHGPEPLTPRLHLRRDPTTGAILDCGCGDPSCDVGVPQGEPDYRV